MDTRQDRVIVEPGEGESLSLGGLGVIFKISAEETGGAFSIVEHPIEAGRLVPPHVHHAEDEFSFVIEGRIGARVGDREVLATAGSYVFKPRDVPHTFWNPGPEPASLIEIISPAGFETFFRELAELLEADRSQDEARAELARKYDHGYVPEWAPDLMERFGLRLLGDSAPVGHLPAGSTATDTRGEAVPHSNADVLRAHLDALAGGDVDAATSFYTDDIVFHYPGNNPLTGDYRGKNEVLGLMGRVMQFTRGTFRPEVHDILASGEHVAALVTVRAEHDGAPVEWRSVDLFHVRDGKLSEHWVHEVDQEAVDRFWSPLT